MAGHGVILSGAYDELRQLAERTGIPVITTLLGISAFPESHPLHLGMPGMHGEVHVNRAIQQADLIIGVGLRFDDRVTGNLAAFARDTCPVIATTGVLSMWAVASPVTRLVAPGPEVATHTPGRPLARA
jgi:thiamine pyrophosphate-dependent acetolactate synthase large subunit-like protein